MPQLMDLPNETLLDICQNTVGNPGENMNKDLHSLALTNRIFTNIVREVLLQGPLLHFTQRKADSLIATLFKYPKQAEKITSLEITTRIKYTDSIRGRPITPRRSPKLIRYDSNFAQQCKDSVEKVKTSRKNKAAWVTALMQDDAAAFLGLLITMLPNLNELLLGGGDLRYLPLLRDVKYKASNSQALTNSKYAYLKDVLKLLHKNLTSLEMPFDRWFGAETYGQNRIPISPDFSPFTNVRTLIANEPILNLQFLTTTILPLRVERVIIVDASFEAENFIMDLLQERQERGITSLYPNLRHVALYYEEPKSCGKYSFIHTLKRLGIRTGVKVDGHSSKRFHIAAAFSDGQPWKLSDVKLKELEVKIKKGTLPNLGLVNS
ncbi:hypothetical protein K504DRAFT_497368 [Pleomassaria siparia CBS 279.74]|uniref:Uncharacterized protein n=1 Tax=Pleomassaria siparia CBS 279.74 TaxID=1314801 RepID=A0A6G1KRL1_9PLEO|nr:hypothetical protein K504DRAFT_497368 [Pleomassaria siparia CBS 279.74]